MPKRKKLKETAEKLREKAVGWTAAGIVGTDPLTDEEKAELLQQQEDYNHMP